MILRKAYCLNVGLLKKVINTESVKFVYFKVKFSKSVANFDTFSLCSPPLSFKKECLPKFCYFNLKMVLLLICFLSHQANVDQFSIQMASTIPQSPFIDKILMLSVEAPLTRSNILTG